MISKPNSQLQTPARGNDALISKAFPSNQHLGDPEKSDSSNQQMSKGQKKHSKVTKQTEV